MEPRLYVEFTPPTRCDCFVASASVGVNRALLSEKRAEHSLPLLAGLGFPRTLALVRFRRSVEVGGVVAV